MSTENQTVVAGYPVSVQYDYPQRSSRALAIITLIFGLGKIIILIPHFIILYFLGIISFVLMFVAQIAVLLIGRYPKGLFDFTTGIIRWNVRVQSYFAGLTDKYPPFGLN